MEDRFVLLTDDIDISADVESRHIIKVEGGLKPKSKDIKWYTPPSKLSEYYSKWQEYDRMDLSDGNSNNDEVLEDGRYNPGVKYVVYSNLKDQTVRIRPSEYKDILTIAKVNFKDQKELPDSIVRQAVAKLIGKRMENPNIKYVICQIEDIDDVIALEDIFATSESVDPVEHDILKNEVKLYVFDPNRIYHATDEAKRKAYNDIKRRVESGFYKKKLEFLNLLRYNPEIEPKNRDSYLRCGVFPNEGESSESCYDRVKYYVERLYEDFERYKDSYEDMCKYVFSKLPKSLTTERNEWDIRYNDEAITEALTQGYVRYFSGLYISSDAEMNVVGNADKRRRLRYNRTFQVSTLAIFDSNALELDEIIEIEEIRQKSEIERDDKTIEQL